MRGRESAPLTLLKVGNLLQRHSAKTDNFAQRHEKDRDTMSRWRAQTTFLSTAA